jgi:LacI family transcriptional regulator
MLSDHDRQNKQMKQKYNPDVLTPSPGHTVTMKHVAKEAGVSLGTVSRVVNKHPSVKPHLREQVERAIAKTGWQPNAVAQSMRTSSTKVIGCVLPDTSNPLFGSIAKGAEAMVRKNGYAFLLANSSYDTEHEIELLTFMFQRRVDGLLFAPSDETNPRMIQAIESARMPTVLMEREFPASCDRVVSNQADGLRQAAEHLISLGHRRIALITLQPNILPGRERRRGFEEALTSAGIPIDPILLRPDNLSAGYAYQQMQELMSLEDPPTAIIMGGNMMLAGAIRALNLTNKRVPEDVSIIAVGDTDLAELGSPPITTVRWDLEGLGAEAASILLDRIKAKTDPKTTGVKHIVRPTEIVLRKSCAPVKIKSS